MWGYHKNLIVMLDITNPTTASGAVFSGCMNNLFYGWLGGRGEVGDAATTSRVAIMRILMSQLKGRTRSGTYMPGWSGGACFFLSFSSKTSALPASPVRMFPAPPRPVEWTGFDTSAGPREREREVMLPRPPRPLEN